ncbi:hypothetical protein D6C92_06815 [Aureobasidium pullulans]|nr:hypothetical protein D6C92_06815 [Aureobasidium pullulans]
MLDPTTLEYIRDLVEETINQALHLTKGASAHGPDLVVLETPGHLAVGQHNRTPITTPASGAHFPVPTPLPSLAWTLNRKSLAAPTASKFSPASVKPLKNLSTYRAHIQIQKAGMRRSRRKPASGDGPKTVITTEGFLRLTYRVDSDGKVLSDWVTMNDDVLRETTNVWCASTCTPSSGTPCSRYEAGSPRNPFPSPGSQFRPRHEAAVSVHTSPDALLNGALVASVERMHRVREQLLTPSRPRQPDFGRGSTTRRRREERSLSPFEDLVTPTPTRRSRAAPASGSARELSAASPSTRRAPASHEVEDPTVMSGGASGLVLPSANTGSPYVRSGATNDPVARMRADRAAEEDRRLALLRNQEEYDLLHSRSPRRRAGSAARFAIQPGSLRKNQLIDAATLQQIKFVKRFFFTVFNDRYYSKSKSYNTASTYTAVSIQADVNDYVTHGGNMANIDLETPFCLSPPLSLRPMTFTRHPPGASGGARSRSGSRACLSPSPSAYTYAPLPTSRRQPINNEDEERVTRYLYPLFSSLSTALADLAVRQEAMVDDDEGDDEQQALPSPDKGAERSEARHDGVAEPSPRSLPAVVQLQLLALPATTSARPESPFPGPGSQYSPNSQAVSVHSSPDAILNGTLIASATRLRRVKEDILSTPSRAERFYGDEIRKLKTFTGVDGAADLVNHIGENHVGHDDEYNPRCAWGSCGWTRKERRDLLMAHVVRHIPDHKPNKCDQCDYRTKELRELTRHKKKREHQELRELIRHKKRHHKFIVCDKCGYRTQELVALTPHHYKMIAADSQVTQRQRRNQYTGSPLRADCISEDFYRYSEKPSDGWKQIMSHQDKNSEF